MLLPGIVERLKHELKTKHKHPHSNLHGGVPNIIQTTDPHFLPYIGAQILMSLDVFNLSSGREWIDIKDYSENGVHRCMSKRTFQ